MKNEIPASRYVTLTITESCNLNCTYCYENHKSKNKMTLETAKKIIRNEALATKGESLIEFDFFGGEPFLNFELIKQIDDYIKNELDIPIYYRLFATTNGTLVHGEIQEWLLDRKSYFYVGLSYDGTPNMQDTNRSNSSKYIDLKFFCDNYPDQDIKMTISQESLHTLADGVIYLHEKGFLVSCNLAYGIDWSDTSNRKVLERELHKLMNYYFEHPEVTPCSMLDGTLTNVANSFMKQKMIRYCGAGIGTWAYHIDGEKYPCTSFLPVSIGADNAKTSQKIVFYNSDIPIECVEEKCRSCVIQSVCPTCYGANYAATGNIYKHDENYCALTKIIIKARSYFQAMRWELGQLNVSEEELPALIKSIQLIQEKLNLD